MTAAGIWAIADLHLPRGLADRTSARWCSDVRRAWRSLVAPDDLVLLGGDIIDRCGQDDARRHLELLSRLPGRKAIVPGNHEWQLASTGSKLRDLIDGLDGMVCVMGVAHRFEFDASPHGVVVAGHTGAWPGMNGGGRRAPCHKTEHRRLQSALYDASLCRRDRDGLVVMCHYPPTFRSGKPHATAQIIERARADLCVFGHVHDQALASRLDGRRHGTVTYRHVAAERRDGHLVQVAAVNGRGLRVLD